MQRVVIALLIPLVAASLWSCATSTVPNSGGQTGVSPGQRCAGFGDLSPFVTGRHPRYPRSQYIAAGAESCSSMTVAENEARRKVSEQISSTLTGTFKAAQRQWGTEEDGGSSFKYVEQVLSQTQVETHFSNPHLIEIVDHATKGDAYGAVAALNRQRAAVYLEPKVVHAAEKFNKAAQRCKLAYAEGRLSLLLSAAREAAKLARAADRLLLEYSVISGQAARYNRKSPWLDMAAVGELVSRLKTRRTWHVFVGAALRPAATHTKMLAGVIGSTLRAHKHQASSMSGKDRSRAVQALKQRLGDNASLAFAVTGTIKGRVSTFGAGGGSKLHICVCKVNLAGQHVGSGRTLFEVTVDQHKGDYIKGGGASGADACQECMENLLGPVKQALVNRLRALKL